MNLIKVGQDAHGNSLVLNYVDYGQGNPVVLIHGWPLSAASWEYQLAELPLHGVRAIAYDRRGFGQSSKPWDGYDYDTLADDLKALLDHLDLQNVTLVGFSMGGGEVARYMSRHNGARVSKVVFVSAVVPFMLKTDDNPSGVDKSTFDDMIDNLGKDRFGFLSEFSKGFYGQGPALAPRERGCAELDGHDGISGLAPRYLAVRQGVRRNRLPPGHGGYSGPYPLHLRQRRRNCAARNRSPGRRAYGSELANRGLRRGAPRPAHHVQGPPQPRPAHFPQRPARAVVLR
ncbi:MAG: alpha/beta hydrolase [Hymenobacter sp.]